MVLGFNIILPFKHYFFDKLISLKTAIIFVVIPMVSTLFGWYVVGMISFGKSDVTLEVENAYGLYGLNLNAFFNSSGYSSFFPPLPSYSVRQYEGYSYMGLGVFILILASVVYVLFKVVSLKRKVIRHYFWLIPFVLLLIALSLFAISNQVTFNDRLLFEFSLPKAILKIGNIFRASGRFIWALYYAIYLFAIICFLKLKISNNTKVILLLLIVSLQFYDIKLLMTPKDYAYGNYEIKPLNEKKWVSISSNFDRIITYPLFENNLGYPMDYQDWCFIALKNNLPITNGYVARESGQTNLEFKQTLKEDLESGEINKNDLFITTSEHIDDFASLLYKRLVGIGYLDGYYYLFSKENTNMSQRKFEPLELYKADSIYKRIDKLSSIDIINKPLVEEDKFQFNIEKNTFKNDIINIQGWAFIKNTETNSKDSVFITLSNDKKSYILKTKAIERIDVAQYFMNDNLKNAGFEARIFTDKMEAGLYNVVVGIKSNGKLTFQSVDQPMIEVKQDMTPVVLKTLPNSSDDLLYNIEEISSELDPIYCSGWAFIPKENSANSTIIIILESDIIMYAIPTVNVQRKDVTSYFNQNMNYDNSGFYSKIDKQKLKKGIYKVGFLISNDKNRQFFKQTEKTIKIE
jgi:uncharacterized membrane protein